MERPPALNAGLSKLPDYKGTAIRRTHLPDADLADHTPGSTVIYRGFQRR